MPRTRRFSWLHFPHLVIAKANGHERLFFEDEDYAFYLENLRQMVREHLLKVYAYCLMPTELRLVVLPNRLILSRIIQKLHLKYSIYMNKKLDRKGHLFNGRFRSIVFLEENLADVIRSVHLWPSDHLAIRAFNYPHSSYKVYISNTKNNIDFLATKDILSSFGNNEVEQRQAFFKFVELFSPNRNGFGILEETKGIGGNSEILLKKANLNPPHSSISLATLAEQICLMLNVSIDNLIGPSRRQELVLARRLLASVASLSAHKSVTEIAIFLQRDKSQVSRLVSQGMDLLGTDLPFSSMYEDLRPLTLNPSPTSGRGKSH